MARIGFNLVADPVDAPRAPVRLWDCQTTWAHLEPARGQWDWARLDRLVGMARGPVLLVLGHPAAWAAQDPHGGQAAWLPVGANRPPARTADWEAYVAAVAGRYAGRIEAYQIWNEPGLPTFYSGDLDRLADLTRVARRVIRRTDPGARIVAAPLLTKWAPDRLLAAYRRAGWPVDVFAAHAYITGGFADWRREVSRVRGLLRDAGAPRKPLWLTETNFLHPDGTFVARPAGLLPQRVRRSRLVARAYWYAWRYPQPFGISFPTT